MIQTKMPEDCDGDEFWALLARFYDFLVAFDTAVDLRADGSPGDAAIAELLYVHAIATRDLEAIAKRVAALGRAQ